MIAGDVKAGTQFTISCCPCRFVCLGRDPKVPLDVLFKQVQACKTNCDFAKGQVLLLRANHTLDRPGFHVLTPVEV